MDVAADLGFRRRARLRGGRAAGAPGDDASEPGPRARAGTLRRSEATAGRHGLSVSDLGASAQMHEMDPTKHAAQLAEARRFIDLAQALGAPYVRVFGNNYVKDVPRADMLAHIAGGLRELGDYARPKGVTVLIASHGDV